MPDIDVDFEDERRDEVINYVSRKYGQDHVAQIITFGTMLARAAIRDVGRVLGMGYGEVDRIAKAVPNQLGIKLDEALDDRARSSRRCTTATRRSSRLIGLAQQLEGVARNASTHAAGVVITPRAADRAHAAPAGDQLRRADDPVRDARHRGAGPAQVRLPGPVQPHDPAQGRRPHPRATAAIDDRPRQHPARRRDDVRAARARARRPACSSSSPRACAATSASCSRRRSSTSRPWSRSTGPGPMDNIPAYIRRKHGQEAVTYLHPLLEPYLEKTYGIFVYQEDIMAAAIALGGFTGPEADTLGYAIRKKKSSVLRAQKEKFVTQAAERGVEPQVIDAVFKAFEPFERYGFNKAHATCYGLIAYQTAYLKANYTVEYMTSVLTAFRDNAEKVAAAIAECRRLGIEVRPPDVHRSGLGVHRRGRRDPVRAAGGQERRRGRDRVDHRGARGAAASSARWPTSARGSTCGSPTARCSSRWPRSGRSTCSGHPAQILLGARRRARRRPGRRSATGSPARRRCSTWAATTRVVARAAAPADARDAGPRAAALGEGAARAVPLRPPDGRGRRAGRPVRDGLLAATSRTSRSTGSASSSAGS